MSHELRSRLGAIMGFRQLLAIADLDEQQKQKVSMILKASDHLLAIVDEVLDISRVEDGSLSISSETVPLQPRVIHTPEISGGNGYVFR